MNYKLAKKLKDAGLFPTRSKAFPWWETEATHPTLSELIEECEKEKDICRYRIIRLDIRKEKTFVECWRIDKDDRFEHNDTIFSGKNRESHKGLVIAMSEGKTPKIAVANLWLELNKK